MQGNGFLIFIVSATVLWAIGKGLGPNIGPAWNVFTGSAKASTTPSSPSSPATSSGSLFQTASFDPNAIAYQPPAIPYLGPGVSIA